ncbi:MAG: hypothetical protein Kow0063_19620 [Anaerolineae bacterium]
MHSVRDYQPPAFVVRHETQWSGAKPHSVRDYQPPAFVVRHETQWSGAKPHFVRNYKPDCASPFRNAPYGKWGEIELNSKSG